MSALTVALIPRNGWVNARIVGEWNTYVEEIVTKELAVKRPVPGIMEGNKIRPVLLRDITTEEEARIDLKR